MLMILTYSDCVEMACVGGNKICKREGYGWIITDVLWILYNVMTITHLRACECVLKSEFETMQPHRETIIFVQPLLS